MSSKPKHIGIAAASAPGTALCYQTITKEGPALCGAHNHPEISIHNHPLKLYKEAFDRNDWHRVGGLLLDSAERLKRAGANFVLCPANTPHQGLDLVRDQSPLPWLHIVEAVADEAARCGYKKLGITGTKYLMDGPVYPAKLKARGIEAVVPPLEQRIAMDNNIFAELVYFNFLPETKKFYHDVFRDLASEGCDAIVMACTEIPLLMGDEKAALPLLDSTVLQARAALRAAVS
jgi:aspartate racemase